MGSGPSPGSFSPPRPANNGFLKQKRPSNGAFFRLCETQMMVVTAFAGGFRRPTQRQ
jgi:hypothetical protein